MSVSKKQVNTIRNQTKKNKCLLLNIKYILYSYTDDLYKHMHLITGKIIRHLVMYLYHGGSLAVVLQVFHSEISIKHTYLNHVFYCQLFALGEEEEI